MTKAILIAAGMGRRLLPLTKDRPKCLLPIGGQSMLDRALTIFRSLGITDITLVTGYQGNLLEKTPGVKTVRNEDFQNNNILFSLMCAQEELTDDVVISYSDILFEKSVAERLLAAKGEILVVADTDWRRTYVGRADHPTEQAEKAVLREGRVRKIGKHLSEAEGDAEFIGLWRLSREACAVWRKVFAEVAKSQDGKPFQAAPLLKKAYVTDFLQELIDRGQAVTPVLIQGGWREIDTFEDFQKAGGDVVPDLRSGQNFRAIINDLKRRPEDAAAELGVPPAEIQAILEGRQPLSPALVDRAVAAWPVSPRDFYLLEDDAALGVRIFRAKDSEKSARVMKRAGKDYYEYRDTAMSALSQFRPEWIRELCVVDDNDPGNAAVQWNNGHFLHQFTYFVGPVNFYYRGADGKKKTAVMNTGDSMYITPFVPHSFASRKNDRGELGHILALTYGNKLGGETRQEVSALGAELAGGLALDFSSRAAARASLLRFHREAASLSRSEVARRAGLAPARLEELETASAAEPSEAELPHLAAALRISLRDLLPPEAFEEPVLVQEIRNAARWSFPDAAPAYEMVELTPVKSLPFSRGLEVNVLADGTAEPDLTAGLHQYLYNVGERPVTLSWRIGGELHREMLAPGDSAYLKPCLPHGFRGKGGRLLALRIGGRVGGDAQMELSKIAAAGAENLGRVVAEAGQWFNPRGSRGPGAS